MDWRDLFTTFTGLEPPVYYLSAAASAVSVLVIIFTICFSMHRLSAILLPRYIEIYGQDFFKTMSFCTYPFGLMILRKYHGGIGYAVCNIPLNTATSLLLDSGEGSPVGNWIGFLKGTQSLPKCITRMTVQVCAGLSAFKLGKFLMTLDLHPEFSDNLAITECVSALNVAVSLGLLIEIIGTAWDVWFHSQHIAVNVVPDKFLKFCNSSLVFCLGGYPTGMFRDPAKAIGLTFGCRGISYSDHILIYVIGPLVGGFCAYRIMFGHNIVSNEKLRSIAKTERKSTDKSSSHRMNSDLRRRNRIGKKN